MCPRLQVDLLLISESPREKCHVALLEGAQIHRSLLRSPQNALVGAPRQGLKANSKKEKYEKIMEKKMSTPIEALESSRLALLCYSTGAVAYHVGVWRCCFVPQLQLMGRSFASTSPVSLRHT